MKTTDPESPEPSSLTYALNDLVLFNNRLDTMRIVIDWLSANRQDAIAVEMLGGGVVNADSVQIVLEAVIAGLQDKIDTHESILAAVMLEIVGKMSENTA